MMCMRVCWPITLKNRRLREYYGRRAAVIRKGPCAEALASRVGNERAFESRIPE